MFLPWENKSPKSRLSQTKKKKKCGSNYLSATVDRVDLEQHRRSKNTHVLEYKASRVLLSTRDAISDQSHRIDNQVAEHEIVLSSLLRKLRNDVKDDILKRYDNEYVSLRGNVLDLNYG